MTDISLESVTGKLNRVGYDAFIRALRHAKSAGNGNVGNNGIAFGYVMGHRPERGFISASVGGQSGELRFKGSFNAASVIRSQRIFRPQHGVGPGRSCHCGLYARDFREHCLAKPR